MTVELHEVFGEVSVVGYLIGASLLVGSIVGYMLFSSPIFLIAHTIAVIICVVAFFGMAYWWLGLQGS